MKIRPNARKSNRVFSMKIINTIAESEESKKSAMKSLTKFRI